METNQPVKYALCKTCHKARKICKDKSPWLIWCCEYESKAQKERREAREQKRAE